MRALTFSVRSGGGSDMRDFRDAKLMAKALRRALAERGTDVSHAEALELVARQFGYTDWNVLAARIEPPAPKRTLVLPQGWFISGSRADLFELGVDPASPGSPARIRSILPDDDPGYATKGFATMMQTIAARLYRGQRIRLRAELRTEAVSGSGTIWLRIDTTTGTVARFDNMEERTEEGALHGTSDWLARDIVLDVPDSAETLNFGFYQSGSGLTEARGFDLSPVSTDIPETRPPVRRAEAPINLDFRRLPEGPTEHGSMPRG